MALAAAPLAALQAAAVPRVACRRGVFGRPPARPVPSRSRGVRTAAALETFALAEEVMKAGSVDAPIPVVLVAALVVTVGLTFGLPALLKPGDDASREIFERDAKSGRRR